MMVLHVARSEQDTRIAQQHVSGRVRPAGSPLTSQPDPDRTRRTRRTAGPVRRKRRPPGPGSAQEPAEPPLREAHPPSDAVPHASRSRRQYTSTGWRRRSALPGGETSVLLSEICGRVAEAHPRQAPPSAGTAHRCSSHACAAGVLRGCKRRPPLDAVARSGGPCAACSRIRSAHPRAACAAGASRVAARASISSAQAHSRCGIATAELSREALDIALIAHTDEASLLDLLPAFLADVRAGLFLFL